VDFDLDGDQRELQRTIREVLADRLTSEQRRDAAERRETDTGLWHELVELGWAGIAVPEEHGGAGLGLVELCVGLEEAGAALAPVPLLETTCAALVIGRAGSTEQRERWLPALAAGTATGAIGTATFVAGSSEADVVVFTDGEDGWIAEGPGAIEEIETLDRLRRYGRAEASGESLPGDVSRGFAEAAVAVAAELTGVCQRALDATVEYVGQREQFGVPVGSFQAVAHRCAEMLLATESTRSATYYAAWAAAAEPGSLGEAAALAKATASESAVEVTGSAIQAHGGIGFTWEADVHWWYKRAQLSAQLLGGTAAHLERLAAFVAERAAA
jgi:alkylation response protein AidB-like acyl-CoA dehydrogenase